MDRLNWPEEAHNYCRELEAKLKQAEKALNILHNEIADLYAYFDAKDAVDGDGPTIVGRYDLQAAYKMTKSLQASPVKK